MKLPSIVPTFSLVSLSIGLLIASLTISSGLALADVIDVETLKPKHYSKYKHRSIVTDKEGNRYRIQNSDTSKGLYISMTEKGKQTWKKHGAFYRYRDGKIIELKTYGFGLKEGLNEVYTDKGIVTRRYWFRTNLRNGPAEEFD